LHAKLDCWVSLELLMNSCVLNALANEPAPLCGSPRHLIGLPRADAQQQQQQHQQQQQQVALLPAQQPPQVAYIGTTVAARLQTDSLPDGHGTVTALCSVGTAVAIGTSSGHVRVWNRGETFYTGRRDSISETVELRDLDPTPAVKHAPWCDFLGCPVPVIGEDSSRQRPRNWCDLLRWPAPSTSTMADHETHEIGTPIIRVITPGNPQPAMLERLAIVSICSIPHTKPTDPTLASCSAGGIIMIWTEEGVLHMVLKGNDDITAVNGNNTNIIATRNSEEQFIIGVACGDSIQVWSLHADGSALNSYSLKPSEYMMRYIYS
jgi:hypothetical protein